MLNTTHLRLTDGITTKDLFRGDNMKVMQYQSGVSNSLDISIDDQIQIAMVGNEAVNQANKDTLNLMFVRAREYAKSRTGSKVYIEGDLLNDGVYWQAEVLDGTIAWSDDMLSGLQTKFAYIVIRLTRKPWLGPLTQIPLSNSSASNNTSGIDVSNANDGSHENFVDIAAADVIGDLPGSIKIEIQNNTNGSAKNKEFFVWHNVESHPADFGHMLEAEDATGSTVAPAIDANCQGGNKATLAWTATTETLIATWSISSTLVTDAAGGQFAALARWKGAFPYTDMWLRLKILTSDGNVRWSGDLKNVDTTRELVVLDRFRISEDLSDLQNLKLALYGFRAQAGTHSLVLDYLQLSPVSGDGGWKNLLSLNDGVAYTEKLIIDDTEGRNYRIDTSSKLSPEFSAVGGSILLVPNRDQRLYFNQCDKDGSAKIDQSWKIKLWYRPRRSSL